MLMKSLSLQVGTYKVQMKLCIVEILFIHHLAPNLMHYDCLNVAELMISAEYLKNTDLFPMSIFQWIITHTNHAVSVMCNIFFVQDEKPIYKVHTLKSSIKSYYVDLAISRTLHAA